MPPLQEHMNVRVSPINRYFFAVHKNAFLLNSVRLTYISSIICQSLFSLSTKN